MFTYLALNLFTIAIPLLRSFEPKIRFSKYFTPLFSAITLTAIIFLIWDYFFTKLGVWSFNQDHVVGIYLLNMPIEEWMFFFAIPFACIFIYEVYTHFFDSSRFNKLFIRFSYFISFFLMVFGFYFIDRLYTSVTFISTSILLVLVSILRFNKLANFFISYIIALIPFFLVNGVLTFLPVVIYNDSENMAIRLFSIPLEDTIYMLLLLLMNVFLYEKLKEIMKIR